MHDGSSTVLTTNTTDSLNHDRTITSIAISPDSRWAVTASLDAVVRIWELEMGTLVERLKEQ
jgi:glucose repression regulatory protein TUP1